MHLFFCVGLTEFKQMSNILMLVVANDMQKIVQYRIVIAPTVEAGQLNRGLWFYVDFAIQHIGQLDSAG